MEPEEYKDELNRMKEEFETELENLSAGEIELEEELMRLLAWRNAYFDSISILTEKNDPLNNGAIQKLSTRRNDLEIKIEEKVIALDNLKRENEDNYIVYSQLLESTKRLME
ncbi:hypothetical protein [Paenibacillus sp. YAF4_2]|uniref:hypothetical protein n=1 Tax=Paenibacillus sp. YAF4_2 TaxID=3233085 RepID=UPI003F9DD0D0